MPNNDLLENLRKILVKPRSFGELRKMVPERFRKNLRDLVRSLVDKGEVVKIRGGRFGLPDMMNLVVGTVQGHPDGFGFVLPENPGESDVFIGPRNFRKAMHGDKVVCRVEKAQRDGKREGSVIRVLERAAKTVTGVFESRGKGGVIIPSLRRIVHHFQVASGDTLRAKGGQVVHAEILEYPDERFTPTAEITEILGYPGELDVEKRIIFRQHDLPEEFPEKVERAASRIGEPTEKDMAGRLDLRNEWVVTIDGETAKDFDDAVSIKKVSGGFEVGVHIADVSHYVKPGSALDAEAYKRGNSNYFPDLVIPMLPFNLSDDICSLRPHVDRLTVSSIMKFNSSGRLIEYRFQPSVINSSHRMTYDEVAGILENPSAEKNSEKAENLLLLRKVFRLIRAKRLSEGSIDFDLPEALIVLDEEGEPEKIIRAPRNEAHMLIEDFMLSANRCAANFLSDQAALYRIHPEPDLTALDDFFEFAHRLGHVTKVKGELHKKLQDVLLQAKGEKDEKLLNYILLRSMKQARYSSSNIGHFGLAFEEYTHFTSPIRRYPDLVVHRLIKAKLLGEKKMPDESELGEIGQRCSGTERVSETASRDIESMYKVRFAAKHEGDEFDGIITGVTAFGIFIELTEILVEGLLRLTDLHDDYYEFNEKEYALVGKRTRKTYRFGQEIKARIKYADMTKKQVELELADAPPTRKRYPVKVSRPKKGGRRKRGG